MKRSSTRWIPGPMPGRNEQEAAARSNRYVAGAMKKKWTAHCSMYLADMVMITSVADVECFWVEPNKRRDPDNISGGIKFVLDGMQKAGVIKNDGWKQVRSITHYFEAAKESKGGVYVTMKWGGKDG
jgi:Holliday junction resolvase RusA-like endonuclease